MVSVRIFLPLHEVADHLLAVVARAPVADVYPAGLARGCGLPFDQLIWETASGGKACWIHVGYRGAGRNRQQVIWSNSRLSIIQANHSRPVLASGTKMSAAQPRVWSEVFTPPTAALSLGDR